jgi:hypothetical protein
MNEADRILGISPEQRRIFDTVDAFWHDMSPEFEIREDSQVPGTWRVEAIDYHNEGVVYVAIFTGPRSHDRAEEYAAFKNG